MFTAMALIRVSMEAVAEAELVTDAAKTRAALTRVLDLELAIMVDSYREHLEAQAQRRDELVTQTLRSDFAQALRLYEIALDVTPSLVVGLDHRGCIRHFNRPAKAVTGYAAEEVIGASFVATLVPDDLRANEAEIIDALLHGEPRQLVHETMIRTRTGRSRDVRRQFTRIKGDTPDGIVLFAIGADVTDVRIAAQRVRQHEKLAALGTLTAGLAHEIRNPLNGAQLHISLLERAIANDHPTRELLEAASVVRDEIKRLARLVSEFLLFAKPTALVKKRFVVQALIARALELATSTSGTGISFTVDAPPQDLVVVADGARLEQVLLNILQNAVEALTPSGGSIVVRARRQPSVVVIAIEDDGPGFSSPDAPVFDAFFSTKPTGTGLGLAISHRIVTGHGGTVDVDSRPGRTCFRLTVPIGIELHNEPDEEKATR